jgi:hypothetical protein
MYLCGKHCDLKSEPLFEISVTHVVPRLLINGENNTSWRHCEAKPKQSVLVERLPRSLRRLAMTAIRTFSTVSFRLLFPLVGRLRDISIGLDMNMITIFRNIFVNLRVKVER